MCCSLKCTGQFSRTRVGGENCGSRLIFIGPGIISLIHNGTVWLQAFIPTNLIKQVKWVHLGIQSTVKCASNLAAMKACSHTVNKNKHSCSGHWVCNRPNTWSWTHLLVVNNVHTLSPYSCSSVNLALLHPCRTGLLIPKGNPMLVKVTSSIQVVNTLHIMASKTTDHLMPSLVHGWTNTIGLARAAHKSWQFVQFWCC